MKLFTTTALVCCLASPALAWDPQCSGSLPSLQGGWQEVCTVPFATPRNSTVHLDVMAVVVPGKGAVGTFDTLVTVDDEAPANREGKRTIWGTRDKVWGVLSQGWSTRAFVQEGEHEATLWVRWRPAKGAEDCLVSLDRSTLQLDIFAGH